MKRKEYPDLEGIINGALISVALWALGWFLYRLYV